MRQPRGVPNYGKRGCCPDEFNSTPNITGSFELDAVIKHSRNKDLPDRLRGHLASDKPFGPLTGYNSYSAYEGDN